MLIVRTKSDLVDSSSLVNHNNLEDRSCPVTITSPAGLAELRAWLTQTVQSLARPALAPSLSRCQAHVDAALAALARAHGHALHDDPHELLALVIRQGLQEIGEMVGEVHTDDLLDRIFSRFCIGK